MQLLDLIKSDIENIFINKNAIFNKNIKIEKLTIKDYMLEFNKLKN